MNDFRSDEEDGRSGVLC